MKRSVLILGRAHCFLRRFCGDSVDKILMSDIQMKATGLSSTSLAILCKVVLTFESVDEILKLYHSNESY